MVEPWGKPRFLVLFTMAYMLWSLVPVAIAVQFGFNAGRSRSTWQGFLPLVLPGPEPLSPARPSLRDALVQSLKLAALTMLIATPLGVALAIARVGPGGGQARQLPDALPARHARDSDGRRAVSGLRAPLRLHTLGTMAQVLGHVTFTVSYVVIIVRGRLFSGRKRVRRGGHGPRRLQWQALRMVLLPMLTPPSGRASWIAFAISIDDFVITAFLMGDQSSATIPVKLYSAARRRRARR